MADHARQQIREYCRAQILNGGTTAGSRVHDSRVWPYSGAELPALAVYALIDRTVEATDMKRGTERHLTIRVEGRAKANADMEDTLDDLDKEVQEILLVTPNLAGLVKECHHAETEIQLSGDMEKPVGLMTADYLIAYVIQEDVPDAIV